MKSSINVPNMKTTDDIRKIRYVISSLEGVVACEINKDKSLVNIVYDNYFLNIDEVIDSIENLGYTVL